MQDFSSYGNIWHSVKFTQYSGLWCVWEVIGCRTNDETELMDNVITWSGE